MPLGETNYGSVRRISYADGKVNVDYIKKTLRIDGTVFDLVADVKKQYRKIGGFTYTLKLNKNKTIKASPVKEGQNASLNLPGNASISGNTVSQPISVAKRSDRKKLTDFSSKPVNYSWCECFYRTFRKSAPYQRFSASDKFQFHPHP